MFFYFFTDESKGTDKIFYNAESVLRALGANGRLVGFRYMLYMLERINEDPDMLLLLTKRLYPETAKHFGVSYKSVERNARTFIHHCWNSSEARTWEQIAGKTMVSAPTNAEFLDIVAAYLRNLDRSTVS